MTEGLITRIGKWIDHKWESKVTESMVSAALDILDNDRIKDKEELEDKILAVQVAFLADLNKLRFDLETMIKASSDDKIGNLKTRLEKLELYCGMTRKADPTKEPVAKSAFSM